MVLSNILYFYMPFHTHAAVYGYNKYILLYCIYIMHTHRTKIFRFESVNPLADESAHHRPPPRKRSTTKMNLTQTCQFKFPPLITRLVVSKHDYKSPRVKYFAYNERGCASIIAKLYYTLLDNNIR